MNLFRKFLEITVNNSERMMLYLTLTVYTSMCNMASFEYIHSLTGLKNPHLLFKIDQETDHSRLLFAVSFQIKNILLNI